LLCGSCNVARNTTQPNTENRRKYVRRLLLILRGGAYGRGWISILIAQWSMKGRGGEKRRTTLQKLFSFSFKSNYILTISETVKWVFVSGKKFFMCAKRF
jgi:hypothetical protein